VRVLLSGLPLKVPPLRRKRVTHVGLRLRLAQGSQLEPHLRRAAITYSYMLNGALGADLIGIAKVLSPQAMIGGSLVFGHSTKCVTLWLTCYILLLNLDK